MTGGRDGATIPECAQSQDPPDLAAIERCFRAARRKTVGTKQTLKAIKNESPRLVLVAEDADPQVVRPILELCRERRLAVVRVASMLELGRCCGIEVGAATASVIG
ncbi:50S ribosomal protein L7ae [Limnochorda pilosa]|uniref:50S ribosomal protein L7ae n=1 Tax=Limnochorda pilosa TaxID=1555112 RepID=A0A0K2SQJ6_LIMPI|nr:50S ribosomal protein L7ae [Limnochorda pilosa]